MKSRNRALVTSTIIFTVLVLYRHSNHPKRTKSYHTISTTSSPASNLDSLKSLSLGKKHRLPQVICIGNKKCSTTALHKFLCSHSMVQCPYNEPHFFDMESKYEKGIDFYKSLMPLTSDNEITFEKTPKYFILREIPQRIKDMYEKENASVKLILSLCDPGSRAYSDFKFSILAKDSKFHKYTSFYKFLDKEMKLFKTFLAEGGLEKLKNGNDTFYNSIITGKWNILLKGFYSFHLRRWLEYFPSKDILVVDGDTLTFRPWEVMKEIENFLNLSIELTQERFIRNKKTSFYCLMLKNQISSVCLTQDKGRTRTFTETSLASKLSASTSTMLKEFYHSYNLDLINLTNKNFQWIDDS